MLKRHILSFTTAAACAIGLSGCSTVSNVMDTATSYVPYILKPYRADVHQGNLVTSEMALQLEKGMTDAQVQFRSLRIRSTKTAGTIPTICGAATVKSKFVLSLFSLMKTVG